MVLPYDPGWPVVFEAEAPELRDALGPNVLALHHIGSTAVPGLMAKPTIDILAVVDSIDRMDEAVSAMAALGYQAKGENGVAGRRYFQKLDGEVHLVHVHAYPKGHPDIARHLDFRDYLRAHPDAARDYEDLKLTLAEAHTWDPKAYTRGKTDLIRVLDRQAAAWRASTSGHPPSEKGD
jgi:GrpB-like predicted nucleotidyltransferase (UPF0157 family)